MFTPTAWVVLDSATGVAGVNLRSREGFRLILTSSHSACCARFIVLVKEVYSLHKSLVLVVFVDMVREVGQRPAFDDIRRPSCLGSPLLVVQCLSTNEGRGVPGIQPSWCYRVPCESGDVEYVSFLGLFTNLTAIHSGIAEFSMIWDSHSLNST